VRIEPRQQLLETWRATVQSSWRDGEWRWGGRDEPNSISDAEQLLCILLPATQIPAFGLDRPNVTADAMLAALKPLGNEKTIPLNLVRIATDYFTRYSEDGRPVFSGGSYYSLRAEDAEQGAKLSEDQRSRDIVDSFAISVTLSLATIGFVRIFRQSVRRLDVRQELRALERMASARLTAAMVGLLRSFSTHVFEASSAPGKVLVSTISKSGVPPRQVVSELRTALQQTIASFGEVLIGSGQTQDLDGENQLFECGWSWGVVDGAPTVTLESPAGDGSAKDQPAGESATSDHVDEIGEQVDGIAENKPYLYFTVVAVDAIEDLFSERTRVLGLLNEEQQRLARALQLRWDLTLSYWSTLATFGDSAVWPLEDPPWQTTDGQRSDYYTLLVTSIVVKDLVRRRGSDARLARVGTVLADLANESRVTRTYQPGDSGLRLHSPGLSVTLIGSEKDSPDGVETYWSVTEIASLLLQRCVVIAGLLNDVEQRARLLRLADRIWGHLEDRRLVVGGGAKLWDQPAALFDGLETFENPSWYYTERVVQGLISTANLLSEEPIVNERLVVRTFDMLYEAEHLYDMERMRGSADGSPGVENVLTEIRIKLARARDIARSRPAAAGALVTSALASLDALDAVRSDGSPAL
jgi:hypothetical protein